MVQRALAKSGLAVAVHAVRDGVEAVEYLSGTGSYAGRAAEETPTLVLLDLKMPRMGGFDVLERMRNDPRTRTVPVVIFSSSREEQDLDRGYALGANSYVQKPVDFQEFNRTVQQICAYWLSINLPPPK
jgi:CheY-like chemotaxis protein